MKTHLPPLLLFTQTLIFGITLLLSGTCLAQSPQRRIANSAAHLEHWELAPAEALARQAVTQTMRRHPKAVHADALFQLGKVLGAKGDYHAADQHLRQTLELDSLLHDTASMRHGDHQLTYAHHLLQYGKLGKAYHHLNIAWRLDSLHRTDALGLGPLLPLDLAYFHDLLLDNSKAETYLEMATQRLALLPDASPNLLNTRLQLATVASHKAGFSKQSLEAMSAYLRADTAAHGFSNPRYAQNLAIMAAFCVGMGDLAHAEAYLLQAIQAADRFYPAPCLFTAEPRIKYASVLFAQGRLPEMYTLLQDAKAVIARTVDSLCSGFVLAEYMLGHHAAGQGAYLQSIPHYAASIRIQKSFDIPPTIQLAFGMQLLFNAYTSQGMMEEAILAAEEISVIADGLPKDQNLLDRNNLSVAYQALGRITDAEAVLRQQLAIEGEAGNVGPLHLLTLYNLVANLQFQAQHAEVLPLLPELVEGTQRLLFSYRTLLGEQENRAIWNDHAITFLLCNSLIFQGGKDLAPLADLGYAATNFQKGYLVRSTRALQAAVHAAPDPQLQQDWLAYLQANAAFVQGQAPTAASEDQIAMPSTIQLERKLLAELKPFEVLRKTLFASADSIRSALHPDEAVVEFVLYNRAHIESQEADYQYGAYVILPGDSITHAVHLCSHADLQAALLSSHPSSGSLYQVATRGVKPVVTAKRGPAKALYELVWAPLQPLLLDAKEIYYSPDGLLHQVAFDALPIPGQGRLSGLHQLTRLTSTSSLMQGRQNLYAREVQSVGIYADMVLPSDQADSLVGHSLPPLPYTRVEAQEIAALLQAKGRQTDLHLGAAGTESQWYAGITSAVPDVLHFATHGIAAVADSILFKTELLDKVRVAGADGDPLAGCGLLFYPESDTSARVQGHRCDGYLAGSEIARLDLQRSRLVVLSACQTGVGEIQGAEGIYGLQRAFFIAGADFVIASLWKVPDVETAEFMGCFYRFFLDGAELHAAFRQTLAEMDRRYPQQPEKWAAFLLME